MKSYTVYTNKDDNVVASGTSKECCKQLGFTSLGSFYSMVSRANKGTIKKYAVVVDEDDVDNEDN